MSYQSLYRKYRSQTFADLIGQDHVVRTLQNAISRNRIAHSYLFTGPRGTGKTSSARLLAKCLNCEQGPTPEPCNVCDQCISITNGNCVDVYEFDAASEAGVDQVRETIVDAVQYAPNYCRYKVFIIDEVHDLSAKAFDALLKTIEEPPSYVIFILATTEYNKVPPTIRSRCQKFEFHRATMQNLVDRLSYVVTAEGMEAEPPALNAIARMADGGYRDALTLLEQALVTSEGPISLQHIYDQLGLVSEETVDAMVVAMKEGNIGQLVQILEEVARRGRDPRAIIESIMHRLSDLTRAAYTVDIGSSGDATREASLFETAARIGRENLLKLRSYLAESHRAIRDVTLPRIWLEAELIRIAGALQEQAPEPARAEAATSPAKATPAVPKAKERQVAAAATRDQPQNPTEQPAARNGGGSKDWAAVIRAVGTVSKSMAMKLSETSVRQVDGKVITVSVPRSFELEWLTNDPKKAAVINGEASKVFGEGHTVEFILDQGGFVPKMAPNEAVELPVEGEALYKAAADTFKTD